MVTPAATLLGDGTADNQGSPIQCYDKISWNRLIQPEIVLKLPTFVTGSITMARRKELKRTKLYVIYENYDEQAPSSIRLKTTVRSDGTII